MKSSSATGLDRPRLLGLLAALALAALAAWPLLSTPGIVSTRAGGDSPFLLLRFYELEANLRAGVMPARWMPDAAYGLGYPFYNYYAALPYYLGALLSLAGAGIVWAIKLTQLIGFLAAAAAMYALALDLLDDPAAAFLASAAYTFAPFHMVNVYVRGDSLSEFYAFVAYPLILWAIVRLRRAPTVGHIALLAASYAGLMVTHNVSALIFSPLAGLALLWAALSAPQARPKVFLAGMAGLLLGAALSAWFWAPALLERGAVSLGDMTTGYFHYSGHFRGANLVQPSLLFDYRITGSQTPFVIGGLQAGVTLLALAAIGWSWLRQRRFRWADLGLLALLFYTVWPITPSSAVAWERVPLLSMAQFPWRFLSTVAAASALIAGVGLSRLGRLRVWLAAAAAVALAISALGLLRAEPLYVGEADVTPERLQLYEQFSGNIGSTVRAEWLPAAAVPRPFSSAYLLGGEPHPTPVAAEGSLGPAHLLASSPTGQSWQLTVSSGQALVVFQTHSFPGWQATVDGSPAPLVAGAANGRIAVEVEEGQHVVELRLAATPLEAGAERVSALAALVTLGLALAGLWRSRRRWPRLALAAALVGATFGMGALLGRAAVGAGSTTAGLATETMDYVQQPYLHPNPKGVAFGATTRLLGYELSTAKAQPGDQLRVRLHWQMPAQAGLRAIVRLATAAEPLFHTPALAESEVPLGAVTEHTFTVPPEVAPGLALLSVEVWGPEGRLAPHTDQGTALGAPYLAPVRVSAQPPAPDLPAQMQFSPALDLLEASAVQDGASLRVHLTWRPSALLPEDYAVSLRLVDPDGRLVPDAGLDVQPRYGLYPTSLWPVGCPVADSYSLALPAGTPPGSGYQVEVTMYRPAGLAVIGSARVPAVTLSRPSINAQAPVRQALSAGLALSAWQPERTELEDGDGLAIRLQWTAQAVPLPDATIRLALVGAQGSEVAVLQGPLSPRYLPSQWPLHALVNERIVLVVPPGTPAGIYRLRLQVLGPGGSSLGEWSPPEQVQVKQAQRNTQVPAFAHAVGADFGGLFRLPGYDLERSGDRVTVTLHWQVLRAPGRGYKIFLHCFDPASEKIEAQADEVPQAGAYPTFRWVAGEVVSCRLVLDMKDVPPGSYQLGVGWYDPATGERLEPGGSGFAVSNRRLLLQQIVWP